MWTALNLKMLFFLFGHFGLLGQIALLGRDTAPNPNLGPDILQNTEHERDIGNSEQT